MFTEAISALANKSMVMVSMWDQQPGQGLLSWRPTAECRVYNVKHYSLWSHTGAYPNMSEPHIKSQDQFHILGLCGTHHEHKY